jgi:hypothetical protein
LGNKNPKVAGEIWNAISKKINSWKLGCYLLN